MTICHIIRTRINKRGNFMYCTSCGCQIKDDSIYCERCGSKVNLFNSAENNYNSKYISLLLEKIRKAQTASLIGIIMSIAFQIALMILPLVVAANSSDLSEHDGNEIMILIMFILSLFTPLNIVSFVVLVRKRSQLSDFYSKFSINTDLEYAKEYIKNLKISSVKAVLVINIVVAVTSFILVPFILAQMIACVYIKDIKKSLNGLQP